MMNQLLIYQLFGQWLLKYWYGKCSLYCHFISVLWKITGIRNGHTCKRMPVQYWQQKFINNIFRYVYEHKTQSSPVQSMSWLRIIQTSKHSLMNSLSVSLSVWSLHILLWNNFWTPNPCQLKVSFFSLSAKHNCIIWHRNLLWLLILRIDSGTTFHSVCQYPTS